MRATGFRADEGVGLDIDEAAFWYETEFGAGKLFLDAVDDTIDRLMENPRRYAPKRGDVRVAFVWGELRRSDSSARGPERKFPHGVYFTVDDDNCVYVWAVASLKREPYYWLDRMRRR